MEVVLVLVKEEIGAVNYSTITVYLMCRLNVLKTSHISK